MPKLQTRTCHEVYSDFMTYLWKRIEIAADSHKRPFSDDALHISILTYLFDNRSIFKEMAFLDEELFPEDVEKYHDIACLDKNKVWSEDMKNVEKDLEPYWEELHRIALRNKEEKKKND